MPNERKQTGFGVAILALLGLFSLPQVLKQQDGEPARSAHATAAGDEDDRRDEVENESDESSRDLKPLLDYLSNGNPQAKNGTTVESSLCDALFKTDVNCLVITLPDPIESVASARFDEYLDVVQRAVELQGYVLDRSLLPWKKRDNASNTPADRSTKVKSDGRDIDLTIETTTPSKPKRSRPGLLVFRHAFPRPEEDPAILLAFLVPESPIWGIQKEAFVRSLDLIDTHFRDKLSTEPDGKRSILHILSPCFNSAQSSLEAAIRNWKPADTRGYHFRMISSNTTQIDQPRIQNIFGAQSRHRLTFHSMVHQITVLKEAMSQYLQSDLHIPQATSRS